MASFCCELTGRKRNLVLTTVFCLIIAVTTFVTWSGPFYVHVFTSLGFGYSALLSSYLLSIVLPRIKDQTAILLSLISSIGLGSLNAWFWLENTVDIGLKGLFPTILLGIIFTSICYYYFHNRELKAQADRALAEAKQKQAEQEKALILSQLRQMQSQIEPHFLFNTLANISALMEQDIAKARTMLEQLTELLRTTLSISRQSYSTVANEIRLIEAYLAIQKVRLDHRLNYHIEVDSLLNDSLIPPMLIQPLVENSIKHGIEPKKQGGTITVTISALEQQLVINVVDDGIGFSNESATQGTGVGLSNIKQRVRTLYEERANVSVIQPESGGFKVSITLPIEQEY